MELSNRIRTAVAILTFVGAAGLQAQQPVASLHDLVGERASSGEQQMRNRGYQLQGSSQSGGSSYTYWLDARANKCVSVRTEDGKYRMIVFTPMADCRSEQPTQLPETKPAVSNDDNFDTVCGVDSGGRSNRYRCHVRNEGCRGEGYCRTILTYPDNEVTITWHKNDQIDVQFSGMNPQRTTTSFSDGLTRFSVGGNNYYFYRTPERARRELANFRQ